MVLSLKVTIQRSGLMELDGGKLAKVVENIQRDTLRVMGKMWVVRYLPKHFTTQARYRYRYMRRRKAWGLVKEIAARTGFVNVSGVRMPAAEDVNPNLDWVLTGRSRKAALAKSPEAYASSARIPKKGANKLILTMRVPLGHAYRPEFKGEITTPFSEGGARSANRDEVNELNKFGILFFKEALATKLFLKGKTVRLA